MSPHFMIITKYLYLCLAIFFGYSSAQSLFPSLPDSVDSTNNVVCNEDSATYRRHLENFTLWAYEMWDATAKSADGTLSGKYIQFGNFDQCLSTRAPFVTKYCLVSITAHVPKPKNLIDPFSLYHDPFEPVWDKVYPRSEDLTHKPRNSVKMGWCIPASCTTQDLQEFLSRYVKHEAKQYQNQRVNYSSQISEVLCHSQEEGLEWNLGCIAFCIGTSALVSLVAYATLFGNGKLKTWFCAKKSYKDLIRNSVGRDPALTILNGIRIHAIFTIIMGHRLGWVLAAPLSNQDVFEKIYRWKSIQFSMIHGIMTVDTLFFLSGLLATYHLLIRFTKGVSFVKLLFYRYLRLIPSFAFVTFYYATSLERASSGPLWKLVTQEEAQNCRDNWWLNFLMLNNYVNSEQMCMIHTWYISCDFHFFLMGMVMCYLITKNKKLGFTCLGFVTVLSAILPFAVTWHYSRPALLDVIPNIFTKYQKLADFQLTYNKSHLRATTYLMGMYVGYVYYQLRDTKHRLSTTKYYTIIAASALMVMGSLLAGVYFHDVYYEYNSIESGLYASLGKAVFVSGMACFIYAVSFGQAGILHRALSWWPWSVLGNLSYAAYLIHMVLQMVSIGQLRNPLHYSDGSAFIAGIADVVLAFGLSFGMHLIIEKPLWNVAYEFLGGHNPNVDVNEHIKKKLK